MKTYYETWLQQERDWIKAIEDKRKKKSYMHAVIATVCCVAVLFGIGFLAGGAGPAVANIKYGLILGICSSGLYLIIMLSAHMADKYIKGLEKEIAGEIKSEAEREAFACGMLGGPEGNEPVSCIEYTKQKGAVPERFCVSSGFALVRGMIPCMVCLDKTERIEVDVVQTVSTVRVGDYKVRMNYSNYPVFFYYRKPQAEMAGGKKQKMDKLMLFPSKALRDEAASMMVRSQTDAE